MELLRAGDVPRQAAAVFRESSVGKRVAFVLASTAFLVLVAVGAGATGREASAPVLLFCVLGGATALLFAVIAWGALRATRRPSNRIVRLHRIPLGCERQAGAGGQVRRRPSGSQAKIFFSR